MTANTMIVYHATDAVHVKNAMNAKLRITFSFNPNTRGSNCFGWSGLFCDEM